MEKGLVHIYTGDGKGKTTAATGLAVRACGAGKRVYIVSFLKTSQSGEIDFIKNVKCDKIKVFRFEREHGFVEDGNIKNIKEDTKIAFDFVTDTLLNEKCDVLILDEIICSLGYGYISRDDIMKIISLKGACEVVMTGRGAPEWLVDMADYVTEMKLIKHPYDEGIDARKGIEF